MKWMRIIALQSREISFRIKYWKQEAGTYAGYEAVIWNAKQEASLNRPEDRLRFLVVTSRPETDLSLVWSQDTAASLASGGNVTTMSQSWNQEHQQNRMWCSYSIDGFRANYCRCEAIGTNPKCIRECQWHTPGTSEANQRLCFGGIWSIRDSHCKERFGARTSSPSWDDLTGGSVFSTSWRLQIKQSWPWSLWDQKGLILDKIMKLCLITITDNR